MFSRAKPHITELLESLEKDVNWCLKGSAPVPALLYCFAIVDCLGALASGDASNHARTAVNSANYMKGFMGYSEEQARLIQQLFRHKLVHLAQPKPWILDNDRLILWRYWHDNSDAHLKLIPWHKTE